MWRGDYLWLVTPDGLSGRGTLGIRGAMSGHKRLLSLTMTLPTLAGPYEMAVKNNPISMKEP